MYLDLAKLSKLLSERLRETVEIEQSELHASGFRSDGFKLTARDGRVFFLKHIRDTDCMAGGFEFPERRISSLLLSHRMAARTSVSPRSFGVWIESGGQEPYLLPDITEDAAVYQIQEFETKGVAYNVLLKNRSTKDVVDEQDRKELEQIVEYITHVHAIRHPATEEGKALALYNDALNARLANPELTFTFLQKFDDGDPFLPPAQQGEYIGAMLQNIREWKGRSDRLRALHGDFWSGNVFIRPDTSIWVVDYSFMPWGDPGIDIGHMVADLMWHYHRTKNRYYRDLTEEFLALYEQKTGDREIRRALCLGYGMMGIVFVAPGLIPDSTDLEAKRRFFENTKAILAAGELVWHDSL